MTLYNIIADGPDGTPHDYDLFVRADSPQEALVYWQAYYWGDDECDQQPVRIDEIPNGPKGAVNWAEVPCVWAPEYAAGAL
jgi:hypothetical protein